MPAASEERGLEQKLASYSVITFDLDPAITQVRIDAVGDEPFTPPARLHLPPGTHELIGVRVDTRATIEVVRGTSQVVVLKKREVAPPPALDLTADHVAEPAVRSPERSRLPAALVIGGATALFAGAMVHVFVVQPAYDDLQDATTGAKYDDHIGRYRAARIGTVGLYVAGAARSRPGS